MWSLTQRILQLAKHPSTRAVAQCAFLCAVAALQHSQSRANQSSPTTSAT